MPKQPSSRILRIGIAAGAAAAVRWFHEGAISFASGVHRVSHQSGHKVQQHTGTQLGASLHSPDSPSFSATAAGFMVCGLIITSGRRGRRVILQAEEDLMTTFRKMLGSEEDALQEGLMEQKNKTQRLEEAMQKLKAKMDSEMKAERAMNDELREEIQDMRVRMKSVRASFGEAAKELKAAQEYGEEQEKKLLADIARLREENEKSKQIAPVAPAPETVEAKEKIEALNGQVSRLAAAKTSLIQKVSKIEDEIKSERSNLKDEEQKVAVERAAGQELKANIGELESEKTELGNKVSELEVAIAAGEARVAAVDADRTMMKQRILEGWSRMQAMEVEKKKLQEQVAEGQQRVVAIEGEKHTIQLEIASKDEEIAQAEAEKTNLEQQLSAMEAKGDMLEFDRSRLKQAILDNAKKISAVQEEKATLERKLAQNAERLKAVPGLQKDIKHLEQTVIKAGTRIMSMEREKNKLTLSVDKAEKEKAEVARRLEVIEAATTEAQQSLASKDDLAAAIEDDMERLKSTVMSSGARISEAESKSAAAQAELEAIKKREIELQSRLNAAGAQEGRLIREYQKLQKQRAEAVEMETLLETVLQAVKKQSGQSAKVTQLELEKSDLAKKLARLGEVEAEGSTMSSILAKSHSENEQLTKELLAMKQDLEAMLAKKDAIA